MTVEIIDSYIMQYGAIAIFVLVFLEYLNLPGFPAGIIMPLAGIFAKAGKMNFIVLMILTVLAGLLGSLILYGVGRVGGNIVLNWYTKKFPKSEKVIHKNMNYIQEKGMWGVFVCKLLPMIRTIIGIPAGILKMNLLRYTIASTAGIFVWNIVLVGAGYFVGTPILEYLF